METVIDTAARLSDPSGQVEDNEVGGWYDRWSADWRCTRCSKLLGRCHDRTVHVQFARGHQYMLSPPISAICRSCGTLNAIRT